MSLSVLGRPDALWPSLKKGHSTVRVVAGSAMPDPKCGNINGSLLMMAEKASDIKTGELSTL